MTALPHWSRRLPFYFGWVIIGIAFVTMAIAVTVRTAYSLLLPPLIVEFGWDRGWRPAPSLSASPPRRCSGCMWGG